MADQISATPTGVFASWAQVGVVIVAVGGIAYWMHERVNERIDDVGTRVSDVSANIVSLQETMGGRIDGKDAEDKSLRESLDGMRAGIEKLGDRLVESNSELRAAINEGANRIDARFDALEKRLETIPGRINLDTIVLPGGPEPIFVNENGELSVGGKRLGTLPAILRWQSE